jgi:dihydroorotase
MRHHKINSGTIRHFVLRQVELWNASDVQPNVDILVENGLVTAIGPAGSMAMCEGLTQLDGRGFVLLPAGVDAQVHLRVPGQAQKETATSGLWAAVSGGVGALLTMPNTCPVLDHVSILKQARQELGAPEATTNVRVLYSAAMTIGQRGRTCVDFEALAHAGVAAFTDDGVGVVDEDVMSEVFLWASRTGLPVLQHAEVPGHGGVLAEGPAQKAIGGVAYPVAAETEMVARDLRLLRQFPKARYHVLHVSAAATIPLIAKARQEGLRVSCEVSPHHLYFSTDDISPSNSSFKMNPPIRSVQDRHCLRQSLADGLVDFVATDHAPHEPAAKTSNFKTSAFGTTGLETSLRVLLDLWRSNQLTRSRLIEVWSLAPARFLGIDAEFGEIKVGRPLNAVLCDVHAPSTLIMPGDFAGLSKNSCFIGHKLPGRIHGTILRSKVHCLGGLWNL